MGYYNKLSVEILGDRNRVEVLRFLYRNRPERFSQKQMSSSLNITTSTMSRTCRNLAGLGLVNAFSAGNTVLYNLDEGSYVVGKFLAPIFENEEGFFGGLIEDVLLGLDPSLKKRIKEILVFGSVLDNEDTPASDIDLAIVIYNGNRAQKSDLIREDAKKIQEYFVHKSVSLKVSLDVHIFFEGEEKKGKGISLKQISAQGMVIWRNKDENSSQKRL